MSVVYDNWERLVEAVLDREKLRQIALCPSFDSVLSDFSSRFSFDSSLHDHVPGSGFPSDSTNQISIANFLNHVHPMEFEEIKLATCDFQSLLGEGGFGNVYKGWIDTKSFTGSMPGSGTAVAVKKWNPKGRQGREEWVTQLHYLGLLVHPNLVKLIAYCFEETSMLLIYEYMPNGSLDRYLFGGDLSLSFSWASRINVAIDVAKALTFLHGREIGVGHWNVEASNILLDYEFKAKLSGFSSASYLSAAVDMSYVSTQFGTYSFGASDFLIQEKVDVFDFGVVLLELVYGRCPIDKAKGNGQEVVKWAESYRERELWQMIDKKMEGQYRHSKKIAYEAATLALQCVSSPHLYRMAEVLFLLEQLKAEQLRLGKWHPRCTTT